MGCMVISPACMRIEGIWAADAQASSSESRQYRLPLIRSRLGKLRPGSRTQRCRVILQIPAVSRQYRFGGDQRIVLLLQHELLPQRVMFCGDSCRLLRVQKGVRKILDRVFSGPCAAVRGGQAAGADRVAAGCQGSCRSVANQASVVPESRSPASPMSQRATVIWPSQHQLSMSGPISEESRLQ